MDLGTKEEYVARYPVSRAEEAANNWEHLSKAVIGKDKSIIPNGSYCYVLTDEKNEYGIPKPKYCPYMKVKEYSGIPVCFCDYLEWGDVGNISDEEYKKLIKHFESKEKMYEELPLFLLFDDCKECGENDYTEDELEKGL